ncbi:MAG: oxidative damage protection protein [Sedimenticola sp.]
MSRLVNCVKLNKEAEGLDRAPYPGELGEKIFDSVSKEAWQMWLQHQTMLINEYRLVPFEAKARKFLEEEMDKFFFGGGSGTPVEFTAPK